MQLYIWEGADPTIFFKKLSSFNTSHPPCFQVVVVCSLRFELIPKLNYDGRSEASISALVVIAPGLTLY